MKNVTIRNTLAGLMCVLLSACSGTYHSYIDTLKLAFSKQPDAELSLQQVQQAEYDFLYVRHGDRPQAAMVLAYIENNQHKWLSADDAMLIIEQGRIVRTLGLTNDLLYLTNTEADPLKQAPAVTADSRWARLADWQQGEYGYQIRSGFRVESGHSLAFFDHELPATLVIETLQYDNPSDYVRLDREWENRYWYHAATGALIQSEQQLSPAHPVFNMVYISRIARLLPGAN